MPYYTYIFMRFMLFKQNNAKSNKLKTSFYFDNFNKYY
ncbi:hypothetical protein FORC89_4011 [Salmonella sp. FORC89]|uniref:Uncharacterized protein n=2 Tax=Salmonella dublin TaxID=98360 RepID=A0A8X6EX40_SALDU|nr:hypothetical protein SeD_A4938 [Salmonella enterica subsp. enterica serovar Dublin str. CT_02021853]AET56719.1 hypothetical protein SPUL_4518 [Salmonella enterica subsp. enterica serovar Gallinarum/Pullorum str. RKS5078]AGU67223.1 hypothetical protein SPUCDC_4503 [Salmonella enterica subsp. enterica serovar Gallinarum/Pullorum str. CDC1983-67]ATD46281.1 hypothetical protein FORC51_4070 [Salmonella enterica]AUC50998.1 CDP-diacylglycerol--glycerol-3-phosphate 3-phosphatidyltransferase [Salmone